MKATAVAPANIAFIKYWGKKDAAQRIPLNPSISMNLSACETTTTVEFSEKFFHDEVIGTDAYRVISHIHRIRELAKTALHVHVKTINSFPASAGIASSASGFAALTLAAFAALGLDLRERELSEYARLGSGSACRSIPDGFVKWEGAFARSLYPPDYWDLRDIIVLVDTHGKKVSSSQGHERADTSPFFQRRFAALPGRIERLERALSEKNFQALGEVIEEDSKDMHHVMQTQDPPLFYWTAQTTDVIELLKQSGVSAYTTVDAGPNVHVMCEAKSEARIIGMLQGHEMIINKPAYGAHVVNDHLF